MSETKTFNLIPNMPKLFVQFLESGRNSVRRWPDEARRHTQFREQVPEVLRTIQAPLAELNVALCSITSTEELEQFRAVFSEIVTFLDKTAAKLEDEL